MLRGATIVCFANIDWRFNHQAPQEVASAFAAAGHRVLFVENTGVRPPALKDFSRLRARVSNWRRSHGHVAAADHGVDVYSPVLIPLPYSPLACRLNTRVMLREIRRWLGELDGPLVVITYLPTPLTRGVIAALDPALVVYYAIDFLSESSPAARPLRPFEEATFREADLVFTTSDALRSFAASMGAQPELLAHGVRFQDFQRARQQQGESPALLDNLTQPIIGFVGSIRRELDLELLAEVAARAQDFEFVFVGPILTDVKPLRALPNVHFVAPVPHSEVARYVARFDIGILPYVRNAYTAHIMPAKLKEYLAAGLPIIGTRLPELCLFAEKHEGMIAFADEPDAFVSALRDVMQQSEPSQAARRVEVAQHYDWATQIDTMRSSMDTALRERETRR